MRRPDLEQLVSVLVADVHKAGRLAGRAGGRGGDPGVEAHEATTVEVRAVEALDIGFDPVGQRAGRVGRQDDPVRLLALHATAGLDPLDQLAVARLRLSHVAIPQ